MIVNMKLNIPITLPGNGAGINDALYPRFTASSYIDYENKPILIHTFIKVLLTNVLTNNDLIMREDSIRINFM